MTKSEFAKAFKCGSNLASLENALKQIRGIDRTFMKEHLQERLSTADSLMLSIIQELWTEDVKIRKSLESE